MAVRSFVFCCVMLAFSMPIEIGRAIEIDFETPFMGQAQLSDPFTDTAFPLCLAPRFKESLFEKIIPGAEDYWFSNDHGLIRNIYTKVFYQRDSSTKKLLSAPLVVVNPGIFSLSFDDGAASVGMELHKRGFHVLILPNAWSSQLRNILRKMPGDIEYEASLMISLSKEFIHHLKGQLAFNGHSSVLGFSYGAFVSLVAKYQTVRLNLDLFNDGAVLASPPFDVLKSRDNLDRYIDETVDQEMPGIFRRYEYAKTFCDKFLPLRLSGKQLKAQNTDQNEWSRIKEIAKLAIVRYSFHNPLFSVVRDFDISLKIGFRPGPELGNGWIAKENAWKKKIRFSYYFKHYNPILKNNAELIDKGQIEYWLLKLQNIGVTNTVIITTRNDFINEDVYIDENRFNENILVFDSGGHGGYSAHRETLNYIFNQLTQ